MLGGLGSYGLLARHWCKPLLANAAAFVSRANSTGYWRRQVLHRYAPRLGHMMSACICMHQNRSKCSSSRFICCPPLKYAARSDLKAHSWWKGVAEEHVDIKRQSSKRVFSSSKGSGMA